MRWPVNSLCRCDGSVSKLARRYSEPIRTYREVEVVAMHSSRELELIMVIVILFGEIEACKQAELHRCIL